MKPNLRHLLGALIAVGTGGAALCAVVMMLAARHLAADRSPLTTAYEQPLAETLAPTTRRHIATTGPTLRVAVIGGMSYSGFWNAVADRYEQQAKVRVEMVVTGPKHDIVAIFKQGGIDIITMHACDAMVNLTADGYTLDPQPWLRNDLVIVGPPDDPAHIAGMTDAAAALKKIADAHANFVVHSSLGAQEVLVNILEANAIRLDPEKTTVLFDDEQRDVLVIAARQHAYTLVGRIPFRIGRLHNAGLKLFVEGDERLRRPYLVAVTNPAWMPEAHIDLARQFQAFLRSPETQKWIATWGKGSLGDRPVFFPGAGTLGY